MGSEQCQTVVAVSVANVVVVIVVFVIAIVRFAVELRRRQSQHGRWRR